MEGWQHHGDNNNDDNNDDIIDADHNIEAGTDLLQGGEHYGDENVGNDNKMITILMLMMEASMRRRRQCRFTGEMATPW